MPPCHDARRAGTLCVCGRNMPPCHDARRADTLGLCVGRNMPPCHDARRADTLTTSSVDTLGAEGSRS